MRNNVKNHYESKAKYFKDNTKNRFNIFDTWSRHWHNQDKIILEAVRFFQSAKMASYLQRAANLYVKNNVRLASHAATAGGHGGEQNFLKF